MIGVYLNENRLTLAPQSGSVVSQTVSQRAERLRALKNGLVDVATPGTPFWLAVNARESPAQLGDLLADCLAEGLCPAGFFDAAALACAAFGLRGTSVVLELQAHGAIATRVIENDLVYRRAAVAQGEGCGQRDLRRACLQRIADVMVRQTRFDPLHDARDEQSLASQLDARLQEALMHGETTVELDALGKALRVTLGVDDFIKAVEPVLRSLRRLLQQMRSADSESNFLIPQSLLKLPGVETMLVSLGHASVFVFDDEVIARAASRCPAPEQDPAGVRLYRQVTLAAFMAPQRFVPTVATVYRKPTHLLFDNRVWSLTGSLSIGRAPDCAVSLPAGLVGVSRQHCTVMVETDECILVDHSLHGTRVNEDPVRGRQRLSAGDRIRIGVPGVELSLITVNDEHGQQAAS